MADESATPLDRPHAVQAGDAPASEPDLEAVVDRFSDAYGKRDIDGVLACFADDAVWTLAPGEFSGKKAIRTYLEWDAQLSPTCTFHRCGVGVVVTGNVATVEGVIEASADGIAYRSPFARVFEFDREGRIRRIRSYYDKLDILQQVAHRYPGAKGWVLKTIIDYLVAQGEKGLDRSALSGRESAD